MTANFISIYELCPIQFRVVQSWGTYHELMYLYCGHPVASMFYFMN